MKKALFVGDEPNQNNAHPAVAFVGAKSFSRLVKWIKQIEPDYYVVVNIDDHRAIGIIQELFRTGFKVVALGKTASKVLQYMAVSHVTLPHPSGKNRKLNCNKTVETYLRTAREYVSKTA